MLWSCLSDQLVLTVVWCQITVELFVFIIRFPTFGLGVGYHLLEDMCWDLFIVGEFHVIGSAACLLYTSDAADE